jgi:hypothetical protein
MNNERKKLLKRCLVCVMSALKITASCQNKQNQLKEHAFEL